MCPVAGHRLRIVFESHANRCDRLAIIPVQCRERSCTARPRAGAREIPATSSVFQPEAIKSCKNPPSRPTLFHFLGVLDAFGWLTDGLQSLLAVSNSPRSVNEPQVVAVLRETRQKAPMWRRSDHFIGTGEGLQVAFTSSRVDLLSVRGLSTSDKGRANWRQTRSIIVATPIPPPIHIVISAADLFWRSSSSSTVPISIPPVAPSG